MPLPAFFTSEEVNPEHLKPEDITAIGTIRGPGKFEGEMYYVPYFDVAAGGSDETVCDDNDECYEIFGISERERVLFPELNGVYSLWLYERSDGFVIAMHMSKKEDAAARRKLGAD